MGVGCCQYMCTGIIRLLCLPFLLKLYTFGEPRFGNDKLRQYAEKTVETTYRVVHERDPVPHLIPAILGFHHKATEVWTDLCTITCVKTHA